MADKYVYSFGGGTADGRADMKNLLGGKGANLAEMANLGIPVPAGFTITTEICTVYYKMERNYPPELNCGYTGEILSVQLRLVRTWVESMPDIVYVLACHHPLDRIASKSRSSLLWLCSQTSVSGILTGHTHAGGFRHHAISREKDVLEINVGSTSDWPMEWRSLVVYNRGEESYVKTTYFRLVDALRNREGFFFHGWEIPQGSDDDYRKYKIGEPTERTLLDYYLVFHLWPPAFGRPSVATPQAAYDTEVQVKDTMLWTYDRMIRTFPTDAGEATPWPHGCRSDADVRARIAAASERDVPIKQKIALLMDLEPFERGRRTADPATGRSTDEDRRRFRLSQAVWASRYEVTSGRGLSPDDELIRIRTQPVETAP